TTRPLSLANTDLARLAACGVNQNVSTTSRGDSFLICGIGATAADSWSFRRGGRRHSFPPTGPGARTGGNPLMKTTALALVAAMAVILGGGDATVAADYPTRPVSLVLAFPPGGASDVLARILGRKLEQVLGQPVVIENRPGAGGNI